MSDSPDSISQANTVIDAFHRNIHEGFVYTTTGKQTALTNGSSVEFLIDVPALTWPHIQSMRLNFGRGDIDFVIYEGPTVSANGSELTYQNVNRNSSNTPDLNLYSGPTTSADGTLIYTLWIPPTGTGTGQSGNGISDSGQGNEWVLAPSTQYLARITNNSGATIDWSYEFTWYELDF